MLERDDFTPNMTKNAIKRQQTLGLHVAFSIKITENLNWLRFPGSQSYAQIEKIYDSSRAITATNEHGSSIDENIYRLKLAELDILMNK